MIKILIVDDELVSRKKLQKIMQSIGECETAQNGEDAIRIATGEMLPDLILLDIIMPGINGYEVCKRLKSNARTQNIPVIFLSANTGIEDITQGFELGAVDYITKPFHKAEVKARARTHLSLKMMQEELKAKNFVLKAQMQEILEKTEQLRKKDLQLIEMDRIAGIGTLAAGIAHEINNPLSFIKSSVGLVKKSIVKFSLALSYWDDKPVAPDLLETYRNELARLNIDRLSDTTEVRFERIQRGIARIMGIVESLKSFSRLDMEAVGKIDINLSLDHAVEILGAQADSRIEFVRQYQPLPHADCAPAEINQCMLHIIKNAIDAIDDSGIIKMITAYDQTQDRITIQIVDNGQGMAPEVARRALDPFFTTKPVGTGTGVGLSLTERIIKRHSGDMNIISREGHGTTVTLTLPATNQDFSIVTRTPR